MWQAGDLGEIFKSLDLNGDGKLKVKEFLEAVEDEQNRESSTAQQGSEVCYAYYLQSSIACERCRGYPRRYGARELSRARGLGMPVVEVKGLGTAASVL